MRARDRRLALALLLTAVLAWTAVGVILTSLDPRTDVAGYLGAAALGVAAATTAAPLLWLLAFTRQRRIAYRGDWFRAARRAGWVGLLVAAFVVMRINGVFQPEIGLFLAALALVAEVTLSRR